VTFCVVVVAGGHGRRFGGDKLAAPLAGRPLLAHVLDGALRLGPQLPVVVVGPRRDTAVDDRVLYLREDPVDGGPAAAVVAGTRASPAADVLVVLPGDAPFAADAASALMAALAATGADATVAVAPDGRRQHLLLALRRAALDVSRSRTGESARTLVEGLTVVEVPVSARAAWDVDRPDDLGGPPT
jgi:molybdopterin-guanine dinucleotide biosynthesis protein A